MTFIAKLFRLYIEGSKTIIIVSTKAGHSIDFSALCDLPNPTRSYYTIPILTVTSSSCQMVGIYFGKVVSHIPSRSLMSCLKPVSK